jgi:hypothetical protein
VHGKIAHDHPNKVYRMVQDAREQGALIDRDSAALLRRQVRITKGECGRDAIDATTPTGRAATPRNCETKERKKYADTEPREKRDNDEGEVAPPSTSSAVTRGSVGASADHDAN